MARRTKQAIYAPKDLPGFIGNFEMKITKSYRSVLPAEFRIFLDKGAIITKGFESAFIIIPQQNWQKLIEPISNTSFLQSSIRDTTRYIVANSYLLDFDDQGRFIIPLPLRKHFSEMNIQVPGKLVFAGMLDYIEVWAPDIWEKNQKVLNSSINKIAESINNVAK